VGELGAHLKVVDRALGVEVTQRGSSLWIRSVGGSVDRAARVLEQLYALVRQGQPLGPEEVEHAIHILEHDPDARLEQYFGEAILVGMRSRPISPRTPGQAAYVQALRDHDVTFAVGPAGTGKTYLAMAMAVADLLRGDVRRIILTRPAVEAGEKLGFLPGDLTEKVNPYLRPLYDAMDDMLPKDRIARLLERNTVEVAPLAFMRGRTLDDAWVILDEAQNTTIEQMRMFLTRMGRSSRMVITGDVTQVDLPRGRPSGMIRALEILSVVEGIAVVHLHSRDVVRHPLVARIIDAWEEDDRARRRATEEDAP
jgi:phosphate starvation-inducible PhoH-like protein